MSEPGKYGVGISINKGDSIVIPKGTIQFSADPRKGTGVFTRHGLGWYAELVLLGGNPKKSDEFPDHASALDKQIDEYLRTTPLLQGLDLDDADDVAEAWVRLQANKTSLDWYNAVAGVFLAIAQQAVTNGESEVAAWAALSAGRFRSIALFKEHFEEVVWMGHSAARIVQALKTWSAQKENKHEPFWQDLFKQNSFILSQVFAAPVVVMQEEAYVGGTKIDGSGGRRADYLMAEQMSRQTIIVEIKTPLTRLLGRRYRGNSYSASAELTGALVQVRDYQMVLVEERRRLFEKHKDPPPSLVPRAVIIAGDASKELTDPHKQRAFRLFRSTLGPIEVITYDELFAKLALLAELFGLKVSTPTTS